MESVQIKICGITSVQDAKLLNRYSIDYAGIVLFFPKSKRNLSLEEAQVVMGELDSSIKKVAVVVSPTMEQVALIEQAGFDIIQIHGTLTNEVLEKISLSIFRAFHIEEMDTIIESWHMDSISGYVLDGKIPGAGKVFDWNLAKKFDRRNKQLMLAGGLDWENVLEGIDQVRPDIVDVSSGVEKEFGQGKDSEKVKRFVEAVRNREKKLF